jgi:hypothetical protein
MAIAFSKLQPGMKLYDVHKVRMGNTRMSQWAKYTVTVLEIDEAKRCAVVSWNGTRAETWSERRLKRLYVTPPKAYREQEARQRV